MCNDAACDYRHVLLEQRAATATHSDIHTRTLTRTFQRTHARTRVHRHARMLDEEGGRGGGTGSWEHGCGIGWVGHLGEKEDPVYVRGGRGHGKVGALWRRGLRGTA